MRFRPKQGPELGAHREVMRFAWLPTKAKEGCCGPTIYVWLERFVSGEEFEMIPSEFTGVMSMRRGWVRKWASVS
jgi:hypothetical protein